MNARSKKKKKDEKKIELFDSLQERLSNFKNKIDELTVVLNKKATAENIELSKKFAILGNAITKCLSENNTALTELYNKTLQIKSNLLAIDSATLKQWVAALSNAAVGLNNVRNALLEQINTLKQITAKLTENPTDISTIDFSELKNIKIEIDAAIENAEKSKSKTKKAKLENLNLLNDILTVAS